MTLSRPNYFDVEELPLHDKERGLDDFRRSKSAKHQLGSAEFCGVLESYVSPETSRVRYVAIATEFSIPELVNVIHFPTDSGKFTSTNKAIQFLTVNAAESNSGLQKVQIKLVLEDAVARAVFTEIKS